jgi:hypothetical protein
MLALVRLQQSQAQMRLGRRDSLLIATTSRTTTSAPISVQIHIPPPIHPYAWFIVGPNSRAKPQFQTRFVWKEFVITSRRHLC